MKSAPVQSPSPVASHSCTALILFTFLLCFVATNIRSQDSLSVIKPTNQQIKKRQLIIGGINTVGYGGTLVVLSAAWYNQYAKTSFHTFNDSREWLQMDKVGHAWTAYNTGKYTADMWKWTGMEPKKAAILGAATGTTFLTLIEFMDAHSSKWGWSWSDIGANFFGSGLYLSQELGWKEQRIQYKFSSFPKRYDPSLTPRIDDLFGSSFPERLLKDYNAQTYWLSVNLKSFAKNSNLPAWLNVAVGYSGEGMLGGFENRWLDKQGNEITRFDIPRTRQFYISPDIDFTKIKTHSKTVHTLLNILNVLKMPAPALMINSKGKLKGSLFYF